MKIDLTDRTALVTGSTEGIGFAIAKGVAGAGAKTFINGRTSEKVEKAIAKLKEALPSADLVAAPGDVGTLEGCLSIKEGTAPSIF